MNLHCEMNAVYIENVCWGIKCRRGFSPYFKKKKKQKHTQVVYSSFFSTYLYHQKALDFMCFVVKKILLCTELGCDVSVRGDAAVWHGEPWQWVAKTAACGAVLLAFIAFLPQPSPRRWTGSSIRVNVNLHIVFFTHLNSLFHFWRYFEEHQATESNLFLFF